MGIQLDIPYPLECSPMGVKVLTQKRTVIITTVLFWGNTFTPMGLHSSGYGINQGPPICIYSRCFCWFLKTTKNPDNDMFECWV